jgi:hypothetical protein
MQHISRPTERAGHYVSIEPQLKRDRKATQVLTITISISIKRKRTCGYDQMRLHQILHAYLIDPSKANDVIMKQGVQTQWNSPLVNIQGV